MNVEQDLNSGEKGESYGAGQLSVEQWSCRSGVISK